MSSFTVRETLLAGSGFPILAALACLIGAAATVPVAAQQTAPLQAEASASTMTPKQILNQSTHTLKVAQQRCSREGGGCGYVRGARLVCCPGLICQPCPQCQYEPDGTCVVPGR